MATSDIKGDLHELITCSVCLETYLSPRQLPCLHVFCLKCIQGLAKPGDAKIVCPVCREDLDLPPGDSDAFPVSFFMNSLCETVHKFESCQSSMCVFCKEDGEETPGTWLCLQCSQTICLPCKKHHKRALGHDIIECSTINKESMQEILKKRSQKCPTHQNEDVKFFCETCQKLICMSCFVNEHKGTSCTTKELSIAYTIYQGKLQTWKAKLEELDEKYTNYITGTTSTAESSKSAVEDVKKKANEYRQIIDKWESETISKMQQSLANNGSTSRLEEVKKKQKQVTSFLKSLNALDTCGTYADLIQGVVAEESQLQDVLRSPDLSERPGERPQTSQVHVHFPSCKSVLGTDRVVIFSKNIEFEVPHRVGGMSLMHGGNLAMSGLECNWAAIYTQSGKLVHTINLPKGTKTSDIECSPDAIYITDDAGQIHVYSYDGEQQPMLDKSLPKGHIGLSFHKGYLYACSFQNNEIRKYDLSISHGKKWSYVYTRGNALNGPAGLKAVDGLLLASNNSGKTVVGLGNSGDVIFRVDSEDTPVSVDCDSDGYVIIPTLVNGKPVIKLHDKQGQYIGCIQDILQGVVNQPIGLTTTGHGQLFCGFKLSESSFKVIGCFYQII